MLGKISKNNVCLLITGCISPNQSQSNIYLIDIKEREHQYVDSIKFYICNTEIEKIVFCENSNFSSSFMEELDSFAKNNGKVFEWLSFKGDEIKVQQKGKGYGEGEILKYALRNSKVLNSVEYFFKVTGRLKVINFNSIFNKLSTHTYFNYDIYRSNAFDTRFYFVEKSFYLKYLEDLYLYVREDKDDIVALEDIFYEKLSNQKIRCLPYFPKIEGLSGGNGTDYSKTLQRSYLFYNILCSLGIFNVFYPFYITRKRIIMEQVGKHEK